MAAALDSGQMRVFLALGGPLLLSCLTWTCSGEQSVYVRCSPTLLFVRMKSTAFHNDLPVAPGEVFLGGRCPVTTAYIGFYEFRYGSNDCNIRIKHLPGNRLLFLSELIFMSNFSDLQAMIPVACMVPCHLGPLIVTAGHDANNQSGPSKRPGLANLYIGNTGYWRVKAAI